MKKTFQILAITFVLCFAISINACAANWKEIDDKYYLDVSSIKRNGNIATHWVKVLNDGSKFWKKNDWFYIAEEQCNCATRQRRTIRITKYNLKGQIIEDEIYDSEWNDIIPSSIAEETYIRVCRPPKPTAPYNLGNLNKYYLSPEIEASKYSPIVKAWLWNYDKEYIKSIFPEFKKAHYISEYFVADCSAKKIKVAKCGMFDKKNKSLDFWEFDDTGYVNPSSWLFKSVFDTMCQYKRMYVDED